MSGRDFELEERQYLPPDDVHLRRNREHQEPQQRYTYDEVVDVNPAQHEQQISRILMQELPSRNRPIEAALERQQRSSSLGRSNSTYNTLRRLRNYTANEDTNHEGLVQYLENATQEQDTEQERDEVQKELLRDLNCHLTWKREVRKKLEKEQLKRTQRTLGCWKYFKYTISMQWKHTKSSFRDFIFSIELWRKSLRLIEGYHGSGVASYFYFLRWLLGLNVLTAVIIFLFVVLPQVLPDIEEYPACKRNVSTTIFTNETLDDLSFNPKDLLTGVGWFRKTLMHYEYYHNTVMKPPGLSYYNLPLAYLLGIGFTLLITLIFISQSLAKSHRKYYIETQGLTRHVFFNKIFSGWDFAITNKETARLQKESLQRELKEQLSSSRKVVREKTFSDRMVTWFQIGLSNLIALSALAAVGYLIFFLLHSKIVEESVNDIDVLKEMTFALIICGLTLVLPLLFAFMVKFEGYKTLKTQLLVTLFRSLFMIFIFIGVPMYFFFLNYKSQNAFEKGDPKVLCSESHFGGELYRFLLVDFVVWVILYLPVTGLRRLLNVHLGLKFLDLEFDVAWHTWNLLYNQALCWFGTFFIPLFPVIVAIKLAITFYVKMVCVLYLCQPPSRVWKAQRIQTTFLLMTFLILIASMILTGYVIIKIPPSPACGPFLGLEYPYEIVVCVSEFFEENELNWALAVQWFTKPGAVTFILLFLCCVAYYSRSVASARLKMMELLQEQVILEGKDKVFLLRTCDNALRRWQNAPAQYPPGNGGGDVIRSPKKPSGAGAFISSPHDPDDDGPTFQPQRVTFDTDPSPPRAHRHQHHSSINNINNNNNNVSREHIPVNRYESDSTINSANSSLPTGADNPSFSDNPNPRSRFREAPSKWRYQKDPLDSFPGVLHQPPLQNLGSGALRRPSATNGSTDELKPKSKRRK